MWVPITIALVVTLFVSAISINQFIKLQEQSAFFNVTLIISLFLPFSIIFILPIDLISTSIDSNGGNDVTTQYYSFFYLSKHVVLVLWKLNYWITFLLTWLVLPFAQYWYSSGHFKKSLRFRESVFSVVRFLFLLIVLGIVAFVYVLFWHRDWLNFTFLKSLIITVSHIYALILALWLMSHGLIYIPRHTWTTSGYYNKRLTQLYLQLPGQKEKLEDLRFDLKDLSGKVQKLENLNNLEFRDWIFNLIQHIPLEFQGVTYHGDIFANEDLNTKLLSSLMKDLKFKTWRYHDAKSQYDYTFNEIIDLEDRINGQLLHELNFRILDTRWKRILNRYPGAAYMLSQYAKPWIGRFIALVLALLSLVVFESELTHGTRASIINLFVKSFGLQIVKIFGFTFVVLSFMVICAMTSLSQIKIFNIYHINSNQTSDPVSTIFFISYAARLTIPLSYNFLMLLDTGYTDKSQFQEFLGNSIQLIPTGVFLNNLLPRLIIIPILLSLFKVGERLKNWAKGVFLLEYVFDEFDFDDDENDNNLNVNIDDIEIGGVRNSTRENQKIQEAKRLIQHELAVFERNSNTMIPNNATRPLSLTLSSPSRNNNDSSGLPMPSINTSIFTKAADSVRNMFSGLSRRADEYSEFESLRTLHLGSRRIDDTLSTANSSIRGSFETDNRLMMDDDIMHIDDDDDDERIIL